MSAASVPEASVDPNREPNPAFPICEHIKDNGIRCGSPAIHGRHFCYFHSRAHSPGPRLGTRSYRASLPETIETLQLAIMQITEALGSGSITDKTAGKLLYAVQLSTNLLKMKIAQKPNPAPCKPSVGSSEVLDQPEGDVVDEQKSGNVDAQDSEVVEEPLVSEIPAAMEEALNRPPQQPSYDDLFPPPAPKVRAISREKFEVLAADLMTDKQRLQIRPTLGDGEANPNYNRALRRISAHHAAYAKLEEAGVPHDDPRIQEYLRIREQL